MTGEMVPGSSRGTGSGVPAFCASSVLRDKHAFLDSALPHPRLRLGVGLLVLLRWLEEIPCKARDDRLRLETPELVSVDRCIFVVSGTWYW